MQNGRPPAGIVRRDDFRLCLARNFIHEILPSASLRQDSPLNAGPIDLLDLAVLELSPQPPGGRGSQWPGSSRRWPADPAGAAGRGTRPRPPGRSLPKKLPNLHFEAIDARRGLRQHAGVLADHQAGAVFVKNIESRHRGRGPGIRKAPGLCPGGRSGSLLNIPARQLIDQPGPDAIPLPSPGNAETCNVAPVDWLAAPTRSGARLHGYSVPCTTTKDTLISPCAQAAPARACLVRGIVHGRNGVIVLTIPVRAPLPGISVHVIESKGIGSE